MTWNRFLRMGIVIVVIGASGGAARAQAPKPPEFPQYVFEGTQLRVLPSTDQGRKYRRTRPGRAPGDHMIACGVWPTSRGLVAVLIDSAGCTSSFFVPDTDDARWGLSQRLAAVGADLVLDQTLLQFDRIAYVARRAGITVWIAGPPLVGALRSATGLTRRGARPSAALLARLPAIPWLRSLLRRLEPHSDQRQIALL